MIEAWNEDFRNFSTAADFFGPSKKERLASEAKS